MVSRDPKLVALLFNECITRQDIVALGALMSDDHTFIDSAGTTSRPKEFMIKSWEKFFELFPDYQNTFSRLESIGNIVSIVGFAYWKIEKPYDPVLWSVRIENNLVAEWRIHEDTPENRKLLHLF
jgi:hypothetical protein